MISEIGGAGARLLARKLAFVYYSCMATKTITLELDAYDKLKRQKRGPRESFSSVVRRARWEESTTAGDALGALRELHRLHPNAFLDEETLDRIDEKASSRTRRSRPKAPA